MGGIFSSPENNNNTSGGNDSDIYPEPSDMYSDNDYLSEQMSEQKLTDNSQNGGIDNKFNSLTSLGLTPTIVGLGQYDHLYGGGLNNADKYEKYNIFRMLNELENEFGVKDNRVMAGGGNNFDTSYNLASITENKELMEKLRKAVGNAKNQPQEGGNANNDNFKDYLNREIQKLQQGGSNNKCSTCGQVGGCGCNKGLSIKYGGKHRQTGSKKNRDKDSDDSQLSSSSSSSSTSTSSNSLSSQTGGSTSSAREKLNTSNTPSQYEHGLNIFPYNSDTDNSYSSKNYKSLRRHL